MQEKNAANPIKGWKVEIESKAAKEAAEWEGKPYEPTVELYAEYGADEFREGEADGKKIVLATKDGIRIRTDFIGMCDSHGVSDGVLMGFMQEVKTPGGWIETAARDLTKKYDGDLKVRMTALAEKPRIDPVATIKASPQLTQIDLASVRIYGKPLVENGTVMKDGRTVFNTAFAADIAKMVAAHIKAATGVEADFGFSEITTEGADYNYAEYTLECGSREDALKVLKDAFGIRNAEALTPRWTADADASGKQAVRYAFGMVDGLC